MISESDIKLLESEIMSDSSDGGGRKTSRVIVDGVMGNIFPKISRVDSVYGRVNMRKVYGGVVTANQDTYAGAHAIITDAPDNENVHCCLFTTKNEFDTRSGSQGRIESYLNSGPEWPGFLWENHIAGQKVIQLISRPGTEPPTVGKTLVLRYHEGLGNQVEQYVRIVRVEVTERTMSYTGGSSGFIDYKVMSIKCDISDALRSDFPGSKSNRYFTRDEGMTVVRDTVVADAAVYLGISKLKDPVVAGDTELKVASIYTQLVPNTKAETPSTDVSPASNYEVTVATTPRAVTIGTAPFSQRIKIGQENRGFSFVTNLKPLPAPGTLRVSYRAMGRTHYLKDDGAGALIGVGAGAVNYLTGSVSVTLQALPDDRSSVIFYWGPAETYTSMAGLVDYRPPEYVIPLEHKCITPGSVTISWLSGGSTVYAYSTTLGKLTGAATGSIDFAAGVVYLQPTAMIAPEGDFQIDYTWSTVRTELLTGSGTSDAATFVLAEVPVPGTIEATWIVTREVSESSGSSMSSAMSSKDNKGGTSIVGHGQKARYVTEKVMDPVAAPLAVAAEPIVNPPSAAIVGGSPGWGGAGTVIKGYFPVGCVTTVAAQPTYSYKQVIEGYDSFDITSQWRVEESSSGSVSEVSAQSSSSSITTMRSARDNGSGLFIMGLGMVSYETKTVGLKLVHDYSESSFSSSSEQAGAWENLNSTTTATEAPGYPGASIGGGGSSSAKGGSYGSSKSKETVSAAGVLFRYRTGTLDAHAASITYTPPAVQLDLLPLTKQAIVPGSVQFVWMGTTYVDHEGYIYRNRTATLPGIQSGAIDYLSGVVAMDNYVVGANPRNITVQSLWTAKPRPTVSVVTFNTTLAPVKPGGLVVTVVDVHGGQLVGNADLTGAITGTHIRGTVDYATGAVEIMFGDYLYAPTLTDDQKGEWWYNEDEVTTTDKIWRPWPVDGSSVRYSAVSYTYLPLDASILGLDPVRLPSDGRIPIFQQAGVVVVHKSDTINIDPLTPGVPFPIGKTNLSDIRVLDAAGARLPSTDYVTDLALGTVTLRPGFVIGSFTAPLKAKYREEDMALVTDVQITGQLTLATPLTRDYGDGTLVSSALLFGDLNARCTNVFDLYSFPTWSDIVTGQGASSQFNNIDYPILVVNEGSVTERWRINFLTPSTFQVIGENLGVIEVTPGSYVGSTAVNCSPTNKLTGKAYFQISAAGWGAGWSAGNQLRFNTVSAAAPLWIARTILPGATLEGDSFSLQVRGDVDVTI